MKAFKYRTASSEENAVELLGDDSVALAGGTNILNLMKDYVLEPETVVSIRNLPGTDGIEVTPEGVTIGANVTLADIIAHPAVANRHAALTQALATVATPQIRNSATLGGNLCCHTACWYYTTGLLQGSGLTAKEGDNEYHAIFGNDGACVTVHASSAAPALIALGARIRIAGPGGAREIPLDDFFAIPKTAFGRENILEANELVTHVLLGPGHGHSATYDVRHKASHDWPLSLAAVSLDIEAGVCRAAKICLGAVAPVPWRVPEAEKVLVGEKISEALAKKAATTAVNGAQPLSKNSYKVTTTRTAVKRAILVAANGKWM